MHTDRKEQATQLLSSLSVPCAPNFTRSSLSIQQVIGKSARCLSHFPVSAFLFARTSSRERQPERVGGQRSFGHLAQGTERRPRPSLDGVLR